MSASGGTPQDEAVPSAVRAALLSLLAFAQTRTRIAASEFEEQLLRLLEVAVWAVVALILLSFALLLAAFLIVLVFWDTNRLLATGLLAGLFAVAGGFSVLRVRRCMAARPKFLAATLAELNKDRQRMQKP